jgi:hypothetical protein
VSEKKTIKVACEWCGEKLFKPKEHFTPAGAALFSCKKKKCELEIIGTLTILNHCKEQ